MDLIIAPNTVPLADADAPPTTGTPGYATDGTPGAGYTDATVFPAYHYNGVVRDLINVITAAGLTPDRTNPAQLLAALNVMFTTYSETLRNGTSGLPVSVTYSLTPPINGTLTIIATGGSTGSSGSTGNIMTETGLPAGYGSQQHTVSDGSLTTYVASAQLVAGTPYSITLTQTAGSGASSNSMTAQFSFIPTP